MDVDVSDEGTNIFFVREVQNPMFSGIGVIEMPPETPAMEVQSMPAFDAAADQALFPRRAEDGTWYLRVAASGSAAQYDGILGASAPFSSVTGFTLDGNYVLDSSSVTQIEFDLSVSNAGLDGFDSEVPPKTQLSLSRNGDDNVKDATFVKVGSQAKSPTAFPLTLSDNNPALEPQANSGSMASPTEAGRPDWAGVWGIWGGHRYSTKQYPWLKGSVVSASWSKIEPVNNRFNFSILDKQITTAINNGQYVIYMVYIDTPPAWVYNSGVPKVHTNRNKTYPYYVDPNFKQLVKRMWTRVAQHVSTYPMSVRKKIIGVQVPLGKSGDSGPYSGIPTTTKYQISPNEWDEHQKEMIRAWRDIYAETSLDVLPLFNLKDDPVDWIVNQNFPHMLKGRNIAQMYQMNAEMQSDHLRPKLFSKSGGKYIRGRGELDGAVKLQAGWFTEAPVWNVYWQGLWVLHSGLDIFNQRMRILDTPAQHWEAFTFVSEHAGYKDPATSRYAWVALRDGLDITDTKRFPEAQYGTYKKPKNSPERYTKIIAAMKPFGARQGDPSHQAAGPMKMAANMAALNDVGYNIWPDNYGVFLTQIDANATSQGYWRVGPKNQPYGRFARGFNNSKNKNRLRFNVDDRMFGRKPLAGKERVQVRVVYFDEGTGTWALNYDSTGENNKQAYRVTKTNSGKWKEKIVTLKDANFGNRGPQNSDLSLVNTDALDDIFHMVEVIFVDRR